MAVTGRLSVACELPLGGLKCAGPGVRVADAALHGALQGTLPHGCVPQGQERLR